MSKSYFSGPVYSGNGFITSTTDTITANPGGGQTNATLLTQQVNRVTTTATAGDSVMLPVSIGGQFITVINSGVSALAVFPNGTDSIDGGSASASVTVPVSGVATFYCLTAGSWFTSLNAAYTFSTLTVSGATTLSGTTTLGNFLYETAGSGITAGTTRTQAGATALTKEVNRVDTATNPVVTVAAAASFTTASTTITMGSANTGNIQPGMVVYDNTQTAYVGVVSTYTGTTLTLVAASKTNSSGSTDSLIFNYGSTLGDGVLLPASGAGLDVTVINNTAYPIQVYGNGSDTINGIAATVGVPLPPGDVAQFECSVAGDWRVELGFGASGIIPTMLSAENVQAITPAAQSTAQPIGAVINHVTNVSASGAAVALPAAQYGIELAIENSAANPLTVYPVNSGSDKINGLSANSPVVIPGYTTALFRAASGGVWQSDPFFNGAGATPSTALVQAGSSTTGVARSGGNISVQSVSAGNANAAATTNTVLLTYALPASVLDVAGRQLTIFAAGKFAATANNKVVQIYLGVDVQTVGSAIVTTTNTVSIATSGVVTTSGGGWTASALVTKYGAAGSNTQIAVNQGVVAGSTHTGTSVPVLTTVTESGVIYVTVTGASSTTGAASDVLGQLLDVAFSN